MSRNGAPPQAEVTKSLWSTAPTSTNAMSPAAGHGQASPAQLTPGRGLVDLEEALANELASEERAIAFATGRARAVSLVGELLYRRELEHKTLLTPEQELVQKIREFERGISRFEAEKADLSTSWRWIGVDC